MYFFNFNFLCFYSQVFRLMLPYVKQILGYSEVSEVIENFENIDKYLSLPVELFFLMTLSNSIKNNSMLSKFSISSWSSELHKICLKWRNMLKFPPWWMLTNGWNLRMFKTDPCWIWLEWPIFKWMHVSQPYHPCPRSSHIFFRWQFRLLLYYSSQYIHGIFFNRFMAAIFVIDFSLNHLKLLFNDMLSAIMNFNWYFLILVYYQFHFKGLYNDCLNRRDESWKKNERKTENPNSALNYQFILSFSKLLINNNLLVCASWTFPIIY